jgi:hypothetical protein
MKGLIVEIYRNSFGDCSNKGLSSKVTKCLLVGAGVPEIFNSSADCPPVQIVERNIRGEIYLTAYPVKEDGTLDKGMFGGTFIYSSDSRFREISPYPVPLHDRFE